MDGEDALMKRRVLHVVGGMHRAGIETWLVQVVRRFEGLRVQQDFLVHAQDDAAYDREIESRGCRIYRVRGSRRSLAYPQALDVAFRDALGDGPIDVVHAHEQLWCGLILEAAARAGIGLRIAHSHNDTLRLERLPNLARIAFGNAMRGRIGRAMTHGLSCSTHAAPSLFGPRWREDPRVALHYYGLDFERFRVPEEMGQVRRALGIPQGRRVVGHIGRCEPQKNQVFLADIFREASRERTDLHLLLIGEGGLESRLRSTIGSLNLSSKVTWLKNRPDVPSLMVSAMDAFVLPSLHEGLPLVLLEAQAAGLPCLFSREITGEADLFPETNHRLSHRRPAREWAGALSALLRQPRGGREARINSLGHSAFSAEHSVRSLCSLYRLAGTVPSTEPARVEVCP